MDRHLSDILFHLGENREDYFHAVSPPVIQTSNFVFKDLDHFRTAFESEFDNHIYTRGNNPTVKILRDKISALEKAEDSLIFSSGSGAVANAVIANINAGEHIVCVNSPYSWTKNLISNFLPRFGVTHTYVDGSDLNAIVNAIQENTKILYLESPNSLTFEIQDLAACAKLAKEHGLVTIIDNSYASPLYQNPIELGIDLVVHSGTKYLNGHSDVVLGVVSGSRELIEKIFYSEYMTLGGILPAHDAALVIRGLRTLELRVHRSNESGFKVAKYLESHPKVKSVLHPLLPSFPQYEMAQKQMKGAGGLFSIHLDVERIEQVEDFIHALNRFTMAVSWGGHESLALPAAGFHKIKGRADSPVPFTLIRFYIGLEDPDWLIEDLEQAFKVL